MILNIRQKNIAEKEIYDLSKLILGLQESESLEDMIQVNAWIERREKLKNQIYEYDNLISNSVLMFNGEDLDKFIISLRIASGMTQRQLAEKIEVKEQQIQRYERTKYLTASFDRIIQIIRVLSRKIDLEVLVEKENKSSRFEHVYLMYTDLEIVDNCVKERKSLLVPAS